MVHAWLLICIILHICVCVESASSDTVKHTHTQTHNRRKHGLMVTQSKQKRAVINFGQGALITIQHFLFVLFYFVVCAHIWTANDRDNV